MKRYFLRLLPYFICLISSAAFFYTGNLFESDIKSLMHGISGSFLAIPFLYVIYELSKGYSNQKLNKKLFDYAKMQIDQDVLSIINQIMKFSLSYSEVFLSPQEIQKFLSKSKENIVSQLIESEYIGFQVFKSWSITEQNITKILGNPFILQHLENEQVITIVDLLKEIRSFDFMPKNIKDLYLSSGTNIKGYKIEAGTNINEKNSTYPDRYLLLKELEDGKYLVCDFGDFPAYQTEKLLKTYRKYSKCSIHIYSVHKAMAESKWE